MSILGRLSNLARGYYKTLQSEDPPDLPASELERARPASTRSPARVAEGDADGDEPDGHRHPPTPRPRNL